jgi:hypothetical protein
MKTFLITLSFALIFLSITYAQNSKSDFNTLANLSSVKSKSIQSKSMVRLDSLTYRNFCVQKNVSIDSTIFTKMISRNFQFDLKELEKKYKGISKYGFTYNEYLLPDSSSFHYTPLLIVKVNEFDNLKLFCKKEKIDIIRADTVYSNILVNLEIHSESEVDSIISIMHSNQINAIPNLVFSVNTLGNIKNDTYIDNQWYLKSNPNTLPPDGDVSVLEAWDIVRGNPQIIVAILDEGVDTGHQDLQMLNQGFNATLSDPLTFPWETVSHGLVVTTNLVHGNPMAGPIGAISDNNIGIAGIAYPSKMVSIRCFTWNSFLATPRRESSSITLSAAFDLCRINNWDITNCSWFEHFTSFYPELLDFFQNGRGGLGGNIISGTGNDNGCVLPFNTWNNGYPHCFLG